MKLSKIKLFGLIAAGVVLVAIVIAICTKYEFYEATLKYGLILLGVIAFAFLIWKAFVKGGREDLKRSELKSKELEEEIKTLRKTVKDLDRELAERSNSRFNIVELNPILHLAVLNIDTSFTRTYIREEEDMTFNGALRADICAEYGVKLEEAMFKYDPMSNLLSVANFRPGLISYSKKQLTWDIARSYRKKHLLGHEIATVCDGVTEAYTKRMCEELRTDLEKEIDDRNIAEFDWIAPMISEQLSDLLKLMLGRDTINIQVVEAADESFVNLPTFRRQLALEQLEARQALPEADAQEIDSK